MKIQSDSELPGGYAVIDRSEPEKRIWLYFLFIVNYDENRDFMLNYYNENEFGKRHGWAMPRHNWQDFDSWYEANFDGIYEFIFNDVEDAMAFKLRWM